MLYALYAGFVSVFLAMAALGHALLLIAIYPNFFGTPRSDAAEAGVASRKSLAPQDPKLAA